MFDRLTTLNTKEATIDIINAMLGACLALASWVLGFTGEVAAAYHLRRHRSIAALQ